MTQFKNLADQVWHETVEAFLASPDNISRFAWPFPMAVFGSLRSFQWNNRLMLASMVNSVRPAFLPHFRANRLQLEYCCEATAPFEVFEYGPGEWRRMIENVDRLEGFDPQHPVLRPYYYHRTLAWLRVIPSELATTTYQNDFPRGQAIGLLGQRDLQIPIERWDSFERIPCWIYSNAHQNEAVANFKDQPIIWHWRKNES